MTIGKRENRFISHLLRYSFWTFGIAGAFGAAVLIGASLRAYNNEPSYDLPCVWDYDADSTLEMPYRYDPINNK